MIDGRKKTFFLNEQMKVDIFSSAQVPNGLIQRYTA
jgi:hypothetical protein